MYDNRHFGEPTFWDVSSSEGAEKAYRAMFKMMDDDCYYVDLNLKYQVMYNEIKSKNEYQTIKTFLDMRCKERFEYETFKFYNVK